MSEALVGNRPRSPEEVASRPRWGEIDHTTAATMIGASAAAAGHLGDAREAGGGCVPPPASHFPGPGQGVPEPGTTGDALRSSHEQMAAWTPPGPGDPAWEQLVAIATDGLIEMADDLVGAEELAP